MECVYVRNLLTFLTIGSVYSFTFYSLASAESGAAAANPSAERSVRVAQATRPTRSPRPKASPRPIVAPKPTASPAPSPEPEPTASPIPVISPLLQPSPSPSPWPEPSPSPSPSPTSPSSAATDSGLSPSLNAQTSPNTTVSESSDSPSFSSSSSGDRSSSGGSSYYDDGPSYHDSYGSYDDYDDYYDVHDPITSVIGSGGAARSAVSDEGSSRKRRGRGRVCFTDGDSPCKCENAGTITEAIKEAQDFLALCVAQGTIRAPNRLMAINDYRGRRGCMYLIDVKTGKCEYATTSAYGTGSGAPPEPGCGNGSRMTPAGFHVTRPHNGARYDSSNSLGLVGLQGQDSVSRGVLIHQGKCSGGAATWGCAGVGNYPEVRRRLGSQGALVYNYFGGRVGNCSGARNKNSCRADNGSTTVGDGSYSSGSGAGYESVK